MKFFHLYIVLTFFCHASMAQSWSSLPNQYELGGQNTEVLLMSLTAWNDLLIIGGGIDSVGGIYSQGIANFNGTQFGAMGSVGGGITKMTTYNGDLIILNHIEVFGVDNSANVARWDGTNWHGMGVDDTEPMRGLIAYDDLLFVSGLFDDFGGVDDLNGVAAWNGEQWINVGGGLNGATETFVVYNDTLLLGGWFGSTDVGGSAPGLAAYNEDYQTMPFHGGSNGTIYAMIVDPVSGNLVLGGTFSHFVDEDFMLHPAKWACQWDGQEWSKLGTDTLSTQVRDFEIYRDQIYVCGGIDEVYKHDGDTLVINHIARFDGAEWQALDQGVTSAVYDMEVYDDHLYVVGVGMDTIIGTSEPVNGIAKWYMHPDSVTWGVSVPEIPETRRKILNAFPNPNGGRFSVELKEPVKGLIILTDQSGRQLKRVEIRNEQRIEFDMPDLPAGVYLINLVQGGVVKENVRVVVENSK